MQALAYARPSALESAGGGRLLGLETSGGFTPTGAQAHPHFFSGFLTSPQTAARGLLAVADVAAARYFDRSLRALLDPVVTGNGDRLRFESSWWAGAPPTPRSGPTRRILAETRERPAVQRQFPQSFHWLGHAQKHQGCYHWAGGRPHWVAILPHDRETLVSWLLPGVTASTDFDLPGGTWCLPLLAEADSPPGPAGPALHHALACGLGARRPAARLAAVDALLVLAARGQLDGERLGRELAGLVGRGTVKPNRLAESARTAASTGAYATTWSVLAGALPGLLASQAPVRGRGEILAVAADCVEGCGPAAAGS